MELSNMDYWMARYVVSGRLAIPSGDVVVGGGR